ncbi:transposase [Paraburkholderia sp. SIMBA_030]|uniref:transposase n=1 Tax=Paraburkholderia sp. SIMBA_030 TaxID=3085773 RepID=UPI00397A7DAC
MARREKLAEEQGYEAHGFFRCSYGLSLAAHTSSASPHDVTLVEATLDENAALGEPRRIIGNLADDSDPLDEKLARLPAPQEPLQDGRALRRYLRRWKIERLFAWLNKFKRVLTCWDQCHERYNAVAPSRPLGHPAAPVLIKPVPRGTHNNVQDRRNTQPYRMNRRCGRSCSPVRLPRDAIFSITLPHIYFLNVISRFQTKPRLQTEIHFHCAHVIDYASRIAPGAPAIAI